MKKLLCSLVTMILLASQANAEPISIADWTSLVQGDKAYTKISATSATGLLNTHATVETEFLNPEFSLNLANLGAVNENFNVQYSVEVSSGPLVFDLFRVSENDTLGNMTAGTTISVYSDAFSTLLFTDVLFKTQSGPVHAFAGNLTKIWVEYQSYGVSPSNGLANITSEVTQRDAITAVPEPSSMTLAGIAIVGLAYQIRRRRSKLA